MKNIEEEQLKEDFHIFKKGLDLHIDALQYYIDMFLCDEDSMQLLPDFRDRIKEMIHIELFGEFNAVPSIHSSFKAFSIKRLWRKINK